MSPLEQTIIECFRKVKDDGASKTTMELKEPNGFSVKAYEAGTIIRIDIKSERE